MRGNGEKVSSLAGTKRKVRKDLLNEALNSTCLCMSFCIGSVSWPSFSAFLRLCWAARPSSSELTAMSDRSFSSEPRSTTDWKASDGLTFVLRPLTSGMSSDVGSRLRAGPGGRGRKGDDGLETVLRYVEANVISSPSDKSSSFSGDDWRVRLDGRTVPELEGRPVGD